MVGVRGSVHGETLSPMAACVKKMLKGRACFSAAGSRRAFLAESVSLPQKKSFMDLSGFDPNAPSCIRNNIFGLPFHEEDAAVVLLPVPWEVSVSYHCGTARAPERIFDASMQVDLMDPDVPGSWKKGFFMRGVNKDLLMRSDYLRKEAELYLSFLQEEDKKEESEFMQNNLREVNKGLQDMNEWVYAETSALLAQGKRVGLVGGDHSTPLGYYRALGERHPAFGILHIDAHLDLRAHFENFRYSHASIMYNALQEVPQLSRLVNVGARDYCEEEWTRVEEDPGRIRVFTDGMLRRAQYAGETWHSLCARIVEQLPQQVYLSFDIDGLDPKLCPHTGTPVPGGLEAEQVYYLLQVLADSGRQLIGFDLVEVGVGQGDWDANVGARVLYRLCGALLRDSSR